MLILRCTNQNGIVADLDVLEQVDIKVDMSAIEVGDIGDIFGVSSQSFILPATKNNQDFLGYLDELGGTPATGFIHTIQCQVLNDGIEIFTGKLYVNNVVTNQRGDTTYEVVVVNGTVDFNLAIKNLQIQDLDFSDYDHTYNYANISASWNDNLFSGKVVYPLVDYGVDPDNANATEIAAGGGTGQFDNAASPLTVSDFKPAIKAAVVLEKMFEAVGFNYTSSFINSADFQNIYILSTQDEKPGTSFTNPVSQSFQSYSQLVQTIGTFTTTTVEFPLESFDNGGSFNTGTSKFTAAVTGNYQFYALINYTESGSLVYSDVRSNTLELYKNGSTSVAISQQNLKWQTPGAVRTHTIGPVAVNLQAGDTIEVKDTYETEGVVGYFRVENDSRFEGVGPSTSVGGTVIMNNIFAPETKVIDIFKGLIQKFNLVVEPVAGSRNLLSIEPFNDWVDQGTVVDWTDKVDRNVKFKIQHPLQTQPRTLTFSDVEDKDRVNQYHIENTGKVYGEYEYTSPSDLASGEKKIGTFFAPTPYKGIAGAPTMVLPKLKKKEFNQADSPLKFKPRLLYNLGMYDCPVQLKGWNPFLSTLSPGTYFIKDESGTIHAETQWSHFSHLSAYPAVFNSTKDLHFGNHVNPGHWPYHQNQGNGYVLRSAFYDYWAFYVNELYDVDARLLTCNIILDPSELPTLKLNSKIFIDGQYYRINKIKGASLLDKSSVEVTLLKSAPRQLRYPRRRIFDRYTGEFLKDVISQEPSASGIVEYENFEDGTVVKGVDIINAALLDGYLSYDNGQQTVWEPEKVLTLNVTNNTIQGRNIVDESSDKVLISGDSNTVYASVRNSSVVGNENTLQENVTETNVSGKQNSVGQEAVNVQIVGGSLNNVVSASASENLGMFNTYSSSLSLGSFTNIIGGLGNEIIGSNKSLILNGENMTLSGSTNPVTVIGGENVDIKNGNWHVVIGKDDEITGSLDLDNYRFNTNVLNGTYLDNDLYLNRDGYQIAASSGSTTYAYSGEGLYKYAYEVSWNNVSGSGTHTIELPGIASQDQYGRTILFKADSTIDNTKQVYITVVAGADNIDGRAGIYLNRPYQWVELRASEYQTTTGEAKNTETEWRIIRAGTSNEGFPSSQGTYGSFYSTATQTIATSGSAQLVTFNNTFASQSIALSGSGAIQMDYAGAYKLTYTAQLTNIDNAYHYANFWIRYNGVDYPNSTVRVSAPPRKSATEPSSTAVTVGLLDIAVNDSDKIELYWIGDSTTLSLQRIIGTGTPDTPSVFAQINAV